MPVVSRADCSTLEWSGNFNFRHSTFSHDTSTSWIEVDGELSFNIINCDGENEETNDLGAYYQHLFSEGKVNDVQKASFDKTVVGDDNCQTAIKEVKETLFVSTASKDQAEEYGRKMRC